MNKRISGEKNDEEMMKRKYYKEPLVPNTIQDTLAAAQLSRSNRDPEIVKAQREQAHY